MSVTADVMDRADPGAPSTTTGTRRCCSSSTAPPRYWRGPRRCARPTCSACWTSFPASRTVLIKLAGPRYQAPTRQRLGSCRSRPRRVSESAAPADGHADVEIDVVYDGEDLDEVARLTGLTADAGGRGAHRHARGASDSADSHRVSPTCRRRRAARGPPAIRAAHQGARRVRRAGRRIQRRLPAGVARRLAVDRPHPRRAVGRRPRQARAADSGHVGPVPRSDGGES